MSRKAGPQKSLNPGPGQYGTMREKGVKKSGGFAFGRSMRDANSSKKGRAPGPGFYSKQRSKVVY